MNKRQRQGARFKTQVARFKVQGSRFKSQVNSLAPCTLRLVSEAGFTLIEMIMVMVITGIIGSTLAVFIQAPMQGYLDSARRAGMTDLADTAVRRLSRELHSAVPNSVRMASPSSSSYVEFIPARDGGMYPAEGAASGVAQCGTTLAEDILDFTVADSCFAVMGGPIVMTATDYIIVGSTSSSGAPAYDQTAASGVLRAYTGSAGSVQAIKFSAIQFPVWALTESQRFQVVPGDQQAVSYACIGTLGTLDANGNGQAQLVRYWHYGFNQSQIAPPLTGQSAILVDHVSACNFVYNTDQPRLGLLAISLTLTESGESITLYDEIHVNNVP